MNLNNCPEKRYCPVRALSHSRRSRPDVVITELIRLIKFIELISLVLGQCYCMQRQCRKVKAKFLAKAKPRNARQPNKSLDTNARMSKLLVVVNE